MLTVKKNQNATLLMKEYISVISVIAILTGSLLIVDAGIVRDIHLMIYEASNE